MGNNFNISEELIKPWIAKIEKILRYQRPPVYLENGNREATVLGPFSKIDNWAHTPVYTNNTNNDIQKYILNPLLNRHINLGSADVRLEDKSCLLYL